jgi:hypothetical protein
MFILTIELYVPSNYSEVQLIDDLLRVYKVWNFISFDMYFMLMPTTMIKMAKSLSLM